MLLDDLSGFEFEDVVVSLFRECGYENVQKADVIADEGRDVLFEQVLRGTRVRFVGECKHTDSVGRPVVQKLHSAVRTHETDHERGGAVITSGEFTEPAQDYAKRVTEDPDDIRSIHLFDGERLRDMGKEAGMDLYSGRIEIVCNQTLPVPPSMQAEEELLDAVRGLKNYDEDRLKPSTIAQLAFLPMIHAHTQVRSRTETGAGLIRQVDRTQDRTFFARPDDTTIVPDSVSDFVRQHLDRLTENNLNEIEREYDNVDTQRFGETKQEYRTFIQEFEQDAYTETVVYTGDNNVTYKKECRPSTKDVDVLSLNALYVPFVSATLSIGDYDYEYEYFAAHPASLVSNSETADCVHCGDEEAELVICPNCGAISCPDHMVVERLTGEAICTECAVTETFFFSTKYFYSHDNREQFAKQYGQMAWYRRAWENPPLAIGLLLMGLGLIGWALLFVFL